MSLRTLPVICATVLAVAALSGWLLVPHEAARVHLWRFSLELLLGVVLVPGTVVYGGWLSLRAVSRIDRAMGLVALVSLGALVVLAQRYTDMGVFLLGGGRYWVGQAAHDPSDSGALDCLKVVLSATKYGVNTAENAVGALPDQRQQVRLFTLLSVATSNEVWAKKYRERASRASHEGPG